MNDLLNTMICWWNSTGCQFVNFVLPMLIQSSIIIAIVFILDIFLRNRVRSSFRCGLWLLVFIKLVLPPSLVCPAGLWYWLNSNHISHLISLNTVMPDTSLAPAYSLTKPGDFSEIMPIQWPAVIFALWFAGAIISLAVLTRRWKTACDIVSQAKDADCLSKAILSRCQLELGIHRQVALKVSQKIKGPAACGVFSPAIILPENFTSSLSCNELQAAIVHELAHIKRNDLLSLWFESIIRALYFCHPLLWLANRSIDSAREEAADELAFIALRCNSVDYPQALLNIAQKPFISSISSPHFAGIAESRPSLTRRIRRLVSRSIPVKAQLSLLGFFVLVIMAVALIPMSSGGSPGHIRQVSNYEQLSNISIEENIGLLNQTPPPESSPVNMLK